MISRKMPNPARRNIVIGTVMLATLSAGLPLATKLRAQVPTVTGAGLVDNEGAAAECARRGGCRRA
jgi:hypothetical protein